MLALKEFRNKAMGLPDLLPWAALVDDGIVLTKSGGFVAGFEYRGPDLDSATKPELASMAARINSALMLGDGWAIHCDAIRAQAPGYASEGYFQDRTTRLIDDTRRAKHEDNHAGFVSNFYLTVSWHPDPDSANKAAAMFVDGRTQSGVAERNLSRFKDAINDIEGRLSAIVRVKRLRDSVDTHDGAVTSELLAHLQSCVDLQARGNFKMSEVPMYLDAVMGHQDFTTGFEPSIGNRQMVAISVAGFPGSSFPGILDFLSRLPVEYRWSNRFIGIETRDAESVLNSYRSKWAQKRKSIMNLLRENSGGAATHINHDADAMANDAVAAIAENNSGAVKFGYYTSVILLSDSNAQHVREVAREVVKVINNNGFTARIEDVNAVEAYLGSMPGNTYANVRRPLVHTLNLAHLLPFTAIWPGEEKHPCPFYPEGSPALLYAKTDGSTPFRLTLHSGDLGHTAIVGPTGSGKSTLLATLVAQQFRYKNAQVFAFDKGYSMMPLCLASGGQHYDIAGDDTKLSFCPLSRVDEVSEQVWAAEWIENLAELQGITINPSLRTEIYRAIVQLGESTTESSQRTISDLLMVIQNVELRDALKAYTLSGMAGHLLDAKHDGLGEDIFQVFEMEHLMNKGDKLVLPVLTYLFHRLEQRFKGQPTLLVLDEAWVMLSHPVFKAKIREWLKVLRKANVAVVFATQSLTDLTRSGIADVVFESCPSKILLPNPESVTENVRPLYESIGLNSRQIQILANATPKREYYQIHPEGRRLFELGLSSVELAFVGSSGKEDIIRIKELKAMHGDGWPAYWLRERGQFAAADLWESY